MYNDDEKHETHYCENCLKLSEQLEKQVQEYETLKSENFTFEELIKTQEELIDNYKQALNEIEKIAGSNLCDDDCDVCPDNCLCDWKKVEDIINKAKDGE